MDLLPPHIRAALKRYPIGAQERRVAQPSKKPGAKAGLSYRRIKTGGRR